MNNDGTITRQFLTRTLCNSETLFSLLKHRFNDISKLALFFQHSIISMLICRLVSHCLANFSHISIALSFFSNVEVNIFKPIMIQNCFDTVKSFYRHWLLSRMKTNHGTRYLILSRITWQISNWQQIFSIIHLNKENFEYFRNWKNVASCQCHSLISLLNIVSTIDECCRRIPFYGRWYTYFLVVAFKLWSSHRKFAFWCLTPPSQ